MNYKLLAVSRWLLADLITRNKNELQRMVNLNNKPLAISNQKPKANSQQPTANS